MESGQPIAFISSQLLDVGQQPVSGQNGSETRNYTIKHESNLSERFLQFTQKRESFFCFFCFFSMTFFELPFFCRFSCLRSFSLLARFNVFNVFNDLTLFQFGILLASIPMSLLKQVKTKNRRE
jgi:hypothetical protein